MHHSVDVEMSMGERPGSMHASMRRCSLKPAEPVVYSKQRAEAAATFCMHVILAHIAFLTIANWAIGQLELGESRAREKGKTKGLGGSVESVVSIYLCAVGSVCHAVTLTPHTL